MSPFLKLKPFLPAKPTFMPPVVDPSAFIDMKASLLNSLFPGGLPSAAAAPAYGAAPAFGAAGPVYGAAPAAYSGLSERALLSPFAAPAAPVTKPPPPAFLADLFKALNINKTVANATDPSAAPSAPAFPGAFPVAFPGAAPVVDPGVFISKKAKFLSDLFAGLAVTTPAPPVEAATPDPAALNAELAATLQRLLDSLSASTAAPQDVPEDEIAAVKAKRAADSAALVADAKDKVVDTIIGQLAELKNGMVDAVSDLALAQKATDAANAAAAAAAAPKKPVSPYAAMWAKPTAGGSTTTVKPPPAVEPVRQKVVLLGQVFDMLTDMEKDIASSMAVPADSAAGAAGPASPAAPATPDIMDAVKAKISQLVANSTAVNKTTSAAPVLTTAPKMVRLVDDAAAPGAPGAPGGPLVDPTFWIPDSPLVSPGAYLAKTKVFLENLMAAKSTPSPIARRSYRPSYYQQNEGPQKYVAPTQQQKQQQSQVGAQEQESQANQAALAYQLQQLHHHHHNQQRQPYWWN